MVALSIPLGVHEVAEHQIIQRKTNLIDGLTENNRYDRDHKRFQDFRGDSVMPYGSLLS